MKKLIILSILAINGIGGSLFSGVHSFEVLPIKKEPVTNIPGYVEEEVSVETEYRPVK